MKVLQLLATLALLIAVPVGMASGQSTFATITGVVTDPTGAVVVGAQVEATQVQRNFKYTTQTNEAGIYTLANILEGTYTVVVKAAGFQEFRAENIILSARDIRRVDAKLALATAAVVVEVSGGATLIETESARLADTRSRDVMRALPLTLRRAWDYFTLTPQFERTGGWNLRLAGAGELQATATIDGTTIQQAWGAPIGPIMDRTELVQEMRVDIAQANAESATMGQLTLISRSGNNDFHGTAALYYSNNDLNSRNPFSLTKNKGWGYQWIFGAGGPVYIPKVYNGKNRTFFFWNLEIATGPVSPFTVQRVVPLNRWRNGDFSTYTTQLVDPLNNNAPFSGNIIPPTRINQTAKKFQDLFIPDQNTGNPDVLIPGSPTYIRTYPGNPFVHQPTISERIDHRLSEKQFIFGRLTSVRWNFNQPETIFRELTPKRQNYRKMDALTGAHTYTFRPTLLNEFRYGLSTQRWPQTSAWEGWKIVKDLGFVGLAPNLPQVNGLPSVSFQRSGVAGVSSTAECNPCDEHWVHSFTDNVSWFRGRHEWKFGYNGVRSLQRELRQNAALFGSFSYSGNFTGLDYADFLLGIPTTMSRAFPAVQVNRVRWNHGFFVQDTFRPTPKLTLTLGLRWDAALPWTENDNRLAAFDDKTGKIVIPDESKNLVSPLMPTGYIDIITASAAGWPAKSLVTKDLNNWQPRLGFAYRPWGNNTVIRGGFGLAYNTGPSGVSTGPVVPYVINEPSYTNPTASPLVWPTVYPATGSGGPSTVSIPGTLVRDIQIPRVIQYSLTIEHQRWDTGFMIAYNANGTRNNTYSRAINRPVADGQLYINKPRPFPRYPDISRTENGAGHQYHALTLQAVRKMKGGLYYQTYFVWANDMTDETSPEDEFNRLREKARHDRQSKLRYSANAIYEFPFGKGRKYMNNAHWLVNGILGGWRLSTIVALESGRPLTVFWTGPDPTGTRYTTSATRPQVTLRPDVLRKFTVDKPNQYKWFDATAFAAPPVGRYGTAGRGILIGPGTRVMHNAVAKDFPVKERATVRFEVLARNTLNHPNWANPNTNINEAGVGGIYNVIDLNTKFDAATPRNVQLHLRIEW
jgi:hypothetical protein